MANSIDDNRIRDLVGSIRPNSHRYRKQQAEQATKDAEVKPQESSEKSLARVGSSEPPVATLVERSLFKRFRDAFIADDISKLGENLVEERLIPEAIDLILDLVNDGLSMLFKTKKRGGSRGRTDYAAISNGGGYQYGTYSKYSSSNTSQSTVTQSSGKSPCQILFRIEDYPTPDDAKAKASEVLSDARDVVEDYQTVSVADLYEIAGVDQKGFPDNSYGWDIKLLALAKIYRVREGYILELPSPIPINQ